MSPLPVELLVKVFEHDKDPAWLMELARVCHQWKGVVYDEHGLWTDIRVSSTTTLDQVRTQLLRSGQRALNVSISLTLPSDYEYTASPVFRALLAEFARSQL